jgi:hypothetical protein
MITPARLAWLMRCLDWAQQERHNHVLLIGKPERYLVSVEFGLAGSESPEPPVVDLEPGQAVAVVRVEELRTWLLPYRQRAHRG